MIDTSCQNYKNWDNMCYVLRIQTFSGYQQVEHYVYIHMGRLKIGCWANLQTVCFFGLGEWARAQTPRHSDPQAPHALRPPGTQAPRHPGTQAPRHLFSLSLYIYIYHIYRYYNYHIYVSGA